MSQVVTVRDGALNAAHEWQVGEGSIICWLALMSLWQKQKIRGWKGLSRTIPGTSAVSGVDIKLSHLWQSQP